MRNERLEQETIWAAIEVLAERIRRQDADIKKIKDFLKQM